MYNERAVMLCSSVALTDTEKAEANTLVSGLLEKPLTGAKMKELMSKQVTFKLAAA
jgi:hypothetical protein